MNFRSLISAAALTCIASVAHAYPASLLVNGGFETNNVPFGSYRYQAEGTPDGISAAGWSLTSTTGVANHSSAWGGQGFYNTVGFIQGYAPGIGQPPAGTPSISQTFASSSSMYRVAFELASRPTPYDTEGVMVTLDGVALTGSPIVAPSDAFTLYEFIVEGLTGNTHTLTFTGIKPELARDAASFLDNVEVNDAPEPTSLALVAAALLGGAAIRRQRQAKI